MKEILKVCLVQMEISEGEKDTNLSNVLSHLRLIAKREPLPDIVCLPELFTTGYDLKNAITFAEKIEHDHIGETLTKIREISENNFILIGTIIEKQQENYYNTAFILDKKGKLIGKYRKTHLFSPMLEKEFLTPGDSISTFTLSDLSDLKIGLAICYDLRFPELFRMMALQGADIIFVPAEFPSPKKDVWKTLLIARAIENQAFFVGINRVGRGKSDLFFGTSMITNGDTHYILGSTPEIKTFDIDLSELDRIRETLPLLRDRQNHLYKL